MHFVTNRLKRDEFIKISKETGLHLIAGTSFYVDPLMPDYVKLMSVEEVQSRAYGGEGEMRERETREGKMRGRETREGDLISLSYSS